MAGARAPVAGRLALVRPALLAALSGLRRPWALAGRNPLVSLVLFCVLREVCRYLDWRRALLLGWRRVRGLGDEIDEELIQGCLFSTENLLSLGRVEKRTIFTRQLIELFGGNHYLVKEVLSAAHRCRARSHNCLVARWLQPDERYHALQASLNAVSSLFGSNYVHFSALSGEHAGLFKSTWYCLTIATPMRPESKKVRQRSASKDAQLHSTCTFTDMSRTPRATLRVMLVNESDVRKIADGKLSAPSWGFFNARHAERYRMLVDFARNFHTQLVRTPADCSASGQRSPSNSERAHAAPHAHPYHRPDGGLMKRVHSQPNLASASLSWSSTASADRRMGLVSLASSHGAGLAAAGAPRATAAEPAEAGSVDLRQSADGGVEECCFLRLHVPHFVGHLAAAERAVPNVVVVSGADASNRQGVQAAAAVGLKKVRSELSLKDKAIRMGDWDFGSIDAGMTRLAS